jgi:hypothetical protein
MSGVEDLLALAARVEALSGPDRMIDRDIAIATMGWPAAAFTDSPTPEYTASIDATLTLVPDCRHTELAMQDRHSGRWKWVLRGGYGVRSEARGATPALALCAAALRARSLVSLPSDMEIDSNG